MFPILFRRQGAQFLPFDLLNGFPAFHVKTNIADFHDLIVAWADTSPISAEVRGKWGRQGGGQNTGHSRPKYRTFPNSPLVEPLVS